MKLITVELSKIIPYDRNPRKNTASVNLVLESIKEFGFKVPIVIDKNGVIVAGHTRAKAAKKLGMTHVPCIIADDLTDDQIKAFRLADNKVSEASSWDFELLSREMFDIGNIDMTRFGFEIPDVEEQEDDQKPDGFDYYGSERERTYDAYNLGQVDYERLTNNFWQMPIITNDHVIPDDIIGFNYALSSKNKDVGIHFYIDDYQFERVWNDPTKYVDTLREYECIFSPDFSLYMDMPMPMKIWNIYRSRQIGSYYQSEGIRVIPTISWAEPETFEFCFEGIPKGSTVSISTIGVKRDKDALKIWTDGVKEMMKRIEPEVILLYGGELEFDFGSSKVVSYANRVTENWKRNGR